MMAGEWSEEQISALIDGSIDDEAEAERLREILETDPEARAYADMLERTNALMRDAFDVPEDEETPAAIQAAIFGEPDKVAILKPRRRPVPWLPMAAAACLALVVGVGASQFLEDEAPQRIAHLGDADTAGPLHAALENLPSGSMSDDGVQPILTFHDGAGRVCREFEVSGSLPNELEFGIACRTTEDRWHVEIAVTSPVTTQNSDGYVPASGPGASALEAMLDALEAGPGVMPEDEAALIQRNWRREN